MVIMAVAYMQRMEEEEVTINQIVADAEGWKDTFDALEANLAKDVRAWKITFDNLKNESLLLLETRRLLLENGHHHSTEKKLLAKADGEIELLLGADFMDNARNAGLNLYGILPQNGIDFKYYRKRLDEFEKQKAELLERKEESKRRLLAWQQQKSVPLNGTEDIEREYSLSLGRIKWNELCFLEAYTPVDAAAARRKLHALLDAKVGALKALRSAEISALMAAEDNEPKAV